MTTEDRRLYLWVPWERERWEETDFGDQLQATKYAEDIIFSDKSAVR